MSFIQTLRHPGVLTVSEGHCAHGDLDLVSTKQRWDPDAFAQEQIRGLVQQVFSPGWPRPARQVVFSGIDQTAGVSAVCVQVAQYLAAQLPGHVCLIEANLRSSELHDLLDEYFVKANDSSPHADRIRSRALATRGDLWFIPAQGFIPENELVSSPALLRCRLSE